MRKESARLYEVARVATETYVADRICFALLILGFTVTDVFVEGSISQGDADNRAAANRVSRRIVGGRIDLEKKISNQMELDEDWGAQSRCRALEPKWTILMLEKTRE